MVVPAPVTITSTVGSRSWNHNVRVTTWLLWPASSTPPVVTIPSKCSASMISFHASGGEAAARARFDVFLSGVECSAVQIGQDQVTVKVAFALTGSGRSTRPWSVHLAVGKPFKPKRCSSSIMKHPPGEPISRSGPM